MTVRPPWRSPGEALLESIAGYFGVVIRSREGLRALDARIDALRARAEAAEARVADAEGALAESRNHHERDRDAGERQLHDARVALERAVGEAHAARAEAERAAAEGERLRAEIEAARSASEEAMARLVVERDGLRAEAAAIRSASEEATARLVAERDLAAARLADQLANRDRLESELTDTRAGYEARVAILESDLLRIRVGADFRLRDAAAELARSREAASDMVGRLAATERERDEVAGALERVRNDAETRLAAADRAVAEGRDALAGAREELAGTLSRLAASEAARARAEAEFAAARERLEAQLSRLRTDEEEARRELALANARLEDQYANRDRLEGELAQTRAGYEDRIRKTEAGLVLLQEEAERLRQALAAATAEAGEALKARESVEASMAELERRQDTARQRIAQSEAEREILRLKLAERIEEGRNKDEARAALEGRRDALTAELAKAQEGAARLATLEAERRRLVEERDSAQAALAAARAAHGEEARRTPDPQARALQSAKDELAAENLRLRAQLDAMRLPSVLVVSLVKSGTVFTRQSLSLGLGVAAEPVGFGYFPRYMVELPKLIAFRDSGRVGFSHLDASEVNLGVLVSQLPKWVVHVRDPRSVLVSWVHHLKRLYDERHNEQHQLLLQENPPPEDYHSWSFPERVDWNIRNFLPDVVRWVKDWLVAIDGGRAEILLTTYRDLARSPEAYIHAILDFYGIPRARWRRPVVEKTIQASHFRRGLEDEWKEALTPAQLARANAAIGAELLERFQWERGTTRRARH